MSDTRQQPATARCPVILPARCVLYAGHDTEDPPTDHYMGAVPEAAAPPYPTPVTDQREMAAWMEREQAAYDAGMAAAPQPAAAVALRRLLAAIERTSIPIQQKPGLIAELSEAMVGAQDVLASQPAADPNRGTDPDELDDIGTIDPDQTAADLDPIERDAAIYENGLRAAFAAGWLAKSPGASPPAADPYADARQTAAEVADRLGIPHGPLAAERLEPHEADLLFRLLGRHIEANTIPEALPRAFDALMQKLARLAKQSKA